MEIHEKIYTESHTFYEKIIHFCFFIYLVVTCWTRLDVLFSCTSTTVQILGMCGVILCVVPLFKQSRLKYVLLCFSLSFPLYGSYAYSTHSFLFELYLSILSFTIFLQMVREGKKVEIRILSFLVLVIFLLASASILLLPIKNILWNLFLWDWVIFWNAVLVATPEMPVYSIASINRLALFSVFTILLASLRNGKDLFKMMFLGLLASALWSSLVGILEYYNLFDLSWFRKVVDRGTRLQSTFGNPGWFAEYLAVTIPFVLIGFTSVRLEKRHKFYLFGLLIICEIAIILTYSRTGWIIYPMVLVICWLFFYIAKQTENGRFSWRQICTVAIKVMISVPLTILVSYFLIFHIIDNGFSNSQGDIKKFETRISQITNPSIRKVIWAESIELLKEKPFWGFGYESFKFQNTIYKKIKKDWDTPHNFYLQLLISGGIVGLLLWGLLIFSTLYLLIADLIYCKSFSNIAVILSIIAFHLYGAAQSMQYIPLIWFLVFLNIGYALTINENFLPKTVFKNKHLLRWGCIVIVLSGVLTYSLDLENLNLSKDEKKILRVNEKEGNNYLGFYPPEKWGEQQIYRWTGTSAIIKLPRAEFIELTYVCSSPDLSVEPVVLSVFLENILIDKIIFTQPKHITKQYHIPSVMSSDNNLNFKVSRTWNLKKMGIANDPRNLGVAISGPIILAELEDDAVSTYLSR